MLKDVGVELAKNDLIFSFVGLIRNYKLNLILEYFSDS